MQISDFFCDFWLMIVSDYWFGTPVLFSDFEFWFLVPDFGLSFLFLNWYWVSISTLKTLNCKLNMKLWFLKSMATIWPPCLLFSFSPRFALAKTIVFFALVHICSWVTFRFFNCNSAIIHCFQSTRQHIFELIVTSWFLIFDVEIPTPRAPILLQKLSSSSSWKPLIFAQLLEWELITLQVRSINSTRVFLFSAIYKSWCFVRNKLSCNGLRNYHVRFLKFPDFSRRALTI